MHLFMWVYECVYVCKDTDNIQSSGFLCTAEGLLVCVCVDNWIKMEEDGRGLKEMENEGKDGAYVPRVQLPIWLPTNVRGLESLQTLSVAGSALVLQALDHLLVLFLATVRLNLSAFVWLWQRSASCSGPDPSSSDACRFGLSWSGAEVVAGMQAVLVGLMVCLVDEYVSGLSKRLCWELINSPSTMSVWLLSSYWRHRLGQTLLLWYMQSLETWWKRLTSVQPWYSHAGISMVGLRPRDSILDPGIIWFESTALTGCVWFEPARKS